MKSRVRVFSFMLMGALLLSACNIPFLQPDSNTSMESIQTAAAQTVSAMETSQALNPGGTPGPGITPLGPENTPVLTTLLPTHTAFPTQTPYPSLTPIPQSAIKVCDRAAWVKDVTIPDGTVIAPNTSFVKTWRLRNDGTCTWTTGYKLVFFSGDSMGAAASVALPASVAPGQEADLSVTFTSPAAAGTYKSNWKLQNADGVKFGLGAVDQAFYALINVSAPQSSLAVTGVTGSASPETWDAACPYTITLSADITSSGAGTVTYFFESNAGTKLKKHSVTFEEAGTKTVTEELSGGSAGYTFNGSYKVYIDNPNHQYFTPGIKVTITCP